MWKSIASCKYRVHLRPFVRHFQFHPFSFAFLSAGMYPVLIFNKNLQLVRLATSFVKDVGLGLEMARRTAKHRFGQIGVFSNFPAPPDESMTREFENSLSICLLP